MDPLTAVTAPDPYPYYSTLLEGPAVWREPVLPLWVVARAETVRAVLGDPRRFRVRPVKEPVPAAIAGTAAGEVFGRLIRMNDGAGHGVPRQAVAKVLAGVPLEQAAAVARRQARSLGNLELTEWTHSVPLVVLAELLGFDEADRLPVAREAQAFVRALSPLSTPDELRAASEAAQALRARFVRLSEDGAPGVAAALLAEARGMGWDSFDAVLANLVGLLSQTFEATAGLLGNVLLALHRDPALGARLADCVDEVARLDPSVHNTRRFVAADTELSSVPLRAGDAVLLVLAAANRDPAVNPEPARFLLDRAERTAFGFGSGVHRCPGQALASAITTAAVGFAPASAITTWSYRPSHNARVPVFHPQPGAHP